MKHPNRSFLPVLGLFCFALAWIPAAQADEQVTAEQILNATDDIQRGESSYAEMEMHVKSSRWERTMGMKAWSQGTDQSLVLITAPAKDEGMATLMVKDNIWNYLPKVDRTMKVPASMMSGAWMGSHFSNNDLVKQSRMAEDYSYEIVKKPGDDGANHYVVEAVPKPNAPVVWGKLVVTVEAPDLMPVSVAYFDEDGSLVRTMSFSDPKEIGEGKRVPMRMKLQPADKPEEFTEILYKKLEFDLEIPASTFTLQALKR